MPSVNDGLRPFVRAMVFDTQEEAAKEASFTQDEDPRYRTRVIRRVIRVDGRRVDVFVLVVRRAMLTLAEERAHKQAADSCASARRRIQRTRDYEIEADTDTADLLYRAERSALLLDGGL